MSWSTDFRFVKSHIYRDINMYSAAKKNKEPSLEMRRNIIPIKCSRPENS